MPRHYTDADRFLMLADLVEKKLQFNGGSVVVGATDYSKTLADRDTASSVVGGAFSCIVFAHPGNYFSTNDETPVEGAEQLTLDPGAVTRLHPTPLDALRAALDDALDRTGFASAILAQRPKKTAPKEQKKMAVNITSVDHEVGF